MNAYTGEGADAVMAELLAEYKYFNMDDAMANALQIFTELQINSGENENR